LVSGNICKLGILACAIAIITFGCVRKTAAQGCVVAHSVGEIGGPDSEGGYLAAGHWQLTVDYRHLYSFRHFVGSVEQVYRTQGHSNVRNRVNLVDFGVTYQITPRFSVEGTVPLEWASRRYYIAAHSINGAPPTDLIGDYGLSGVGDVSFEGQGWIWDPTKNPHHNIQIGIGFQAPTGRDNIQNDLVQIPGQPHPMQPPTIPSSRA
jgi:hypothetical protein